MTELTQQKRIDRLAKWAKLDEQGWVCEKDGVWRKRITADKPRRGLPAWLWHEFDPFTDLNHARLLLLECDRRNLFGKLEDRFYTISVHWRLALKSGLLATAEQITEAIEVAAGLAGGSDCASEQADE